MIKLKLLLEGRYEYGCVMAYVDERIAKKLLDFNVKTIGENIIYREGNEYGREFNPHITIKYGFTKSYSVDKMKKMIGNIPPFKVKISGISFFENDKYDVVKLDIKSDVLEKLNKKFCEFPNEDEYDEYHPHLTLAYVKKGSGKKFVNKKLKGLASLPISSIVYSDKGEKSHYDL